MTERPCRPGQYLSLEKYWCLACGDLDLPDSGRDGSAVDDRSGVVADRVVHDHRQHHSRGTRRAIFDTKF